MAHECPECGTVCHCNGDIEDIFYESTSLGCGHFRICEPDDDDEGAGYDDFDTEEDFDCGFVPHVGICTKAGSEECDWECPYAEEFGCK